MAFGTNLPPPKDIPLNTGVYTPQPEHPNVHFDTGAPKRLSDRQWNDLSNNLYLSINATLAARGTLEQNLREWSDAYDLIIGEKDWPFEVSSNISLPFIPAQLESMVAYIAGTVLVPRLYMVTGNTVVASDNAFKVEKFYNAELLRLRSDGASYYSRHVDFLHQSLRDGTAVMEVLWNRTRKRQQSVTYVPVLDATGVPVLGADGMPQWESRSEVVDVYTHDYNELTPLQLKDFILIPSEAPSIEAAAAVARIEWLYEDQLERLVRAGLMDDREVKYALDYVDNGATEVPSDRQGYYDKDASQQIGVGLGQGPVSSSEFYKNRGPIKVWRIHSRQYDMNGDEEVEENIFWLHEQSQRMLGWMPYDYADGSRPFFSFSPFPRPGTFYGYSLIERLAGVQTEMNLIHNTLADQIGFRLAPPMQVRAGSVMLTRDGQYKPGGVIEVEEVDGPQRTMALVQTPDIPIAAFQLEAGLKTYGTDYTGMSQPSIGTQSSGRRSATEMRQQNAGAGTRMNLINMRFRIVCGQIVNFQHMLNKQYLSEDPQTMIDNRLYTLPLDILAQDYNIGISGATDPIDSATRRNEALALYDLSVQNPIISRSPLRLWYATRDLFEAFGKSNSDQLIGTEQDAQQMEQQMQQQAQQAAAQGQPPPGQEPPPQHHSQARAKPPGA